MINETRSGESIPDDPKDPRYQNLVHARNEEDAIRDSLAEQVISTEKKFRGVEQAFLQDIKEHPDDDAPRLIYADWLQERGEETNNQDDIDRGNLIRFEIEGPHHPHPNDKMNKLINKFYDEFKKKYPNVGMPHFWKGFLNKLIIIREESGNFKDQSEKIFKENPLLSELELLYLSPENLKKILDNPFLDKIESLTFNRTSINIEEFELILNCKNLKSLKRLNLFSSNIGDEGLNLLLRSSLVSRLTHINLYGAHITEQGVQFIIENASKLPKLERLDLINVPSSIDIQETLRQNLPNTNITF